MFLSIEICYFYTPLVFLIELGEVGNACKRLKPQMDKVTLFKSWVDNVKLGQTTDGFTVINPFIYHVLLRRSTFFKLTSSLH